MRILVVEPKCRPKVKEIDGSLKSMQDVVGGWIQALYIFDGPVALVCHDEGKLLNLPLNRGLRDENGQIYDIISGTFFLCGAPADCEHFVGLTSEQIEQYTELFYTPEMFLAVDGRIVCLPLEVD